MVLVLKKNAGKKDIEAIKEKLDKVLIAGVDTKKYCGVIKLREDPLSIQKKIRDEWR